MRKIYLWDGQASSIIFQALAYRSNDAFSGSAIFKLLDSNENVLASTTTPVIYTSPTMVSGSIDISSLSISKYQTYYVDLDVVSNALVPAPGSAYYYKDYVNIYSDNGIVISDSMITFPTTGWFQGDVALNGQIKINVDFTDSDSVISFYYPYGYKTLTHNKTTGFSFNHPLTVTGAITASTDLKANSNVYVNNDGADGDSYVYFYEGSSTTGAYLKWNNTTNAFDLSHAMTTPKVTATVTSGSTFRTLTSMDNALVGGTLRVGNAYTLPATDGTANQILATNGTGTVSWADKSNYYTVPLFINSRLVDFAWTSTDLYLLNNAWSTSVHKYHYIYPTIVKGVTSVTVSFRLQVALA